VTREAEVITQQPEYDEPPVARHPDRQRPAQRRAPALLEFAAHPVETRGQDRGDDQEAREGPRQEPEAVVRQRQQQRAEGADRGAVYEARERAGEQVAPSVRQPVQRLQGGHFAHGERP
jgi:hypothetical protein